MSDARRTQWTLVSALSAVAVLFLAADCLMAPPPLPPAAPATRIPVTVLPTQTAYVFAPATLIPVPTLDDLLPMTATTRVPTSTVPPLPTWTPLPEVTRVPPTPSQRPVQRGALWGV